MCKAPQGKEKSGAACKRGAYLFRRNPKNHPKLKPGPARERKASNRKKMVKYSCSIPQVFQKKRNAAKQNGTTCTKKTRFRSAAHFGNKIAREWSREAPAATAQAQQQQQRVAKHCRAQQSTAAAQHSTAQLSRPEQRSKSQHRGAQ